MPINPRKRMTKFKWSSIWFQRSVIASIAVVIAAGISRGYVDYQRQVDEYMDQRRAEYGSTHDETQERLTRQDYQKKFAESNGFFLREDDVTRRDS